VDTYRQCKITVVKGSAEDEITDISIYYCPTPATVENLSVDGSAGKLAAILTIPDGATEDIPIVIFCHGFRSDKNADIGLELTKQLLNHGIATMRFDFNAHGESEGEFVNMTVLNEIEDAVKIYEYVRARPEFGKIAFAGHSLGGVVAAMTAGRLGKEKVSGLALFAAAPVLKDDAVNTALTLPIYEAAAKYRGGACVVNGGSDVIVPVKYGRRFHGVLVGSSFHMLPEEGHNFSRNCRSSIAIGADYLVRVLSPRRGASAK
jgi:alpha/beta superfamily hydrolase